MDIQKIKIKGDYKLADIVHDIEKGILRIPQFQREFVWDKPRVIKLLESIYLEYPIGSFFFWDAPRKYYDFYRDIAELGLPKPDKYEKIVFILDGQQRLTSLYVTVKGLTLYGRDYKKICFDLDEKVFVDRTPDNQRYVSICNLLANERYDVYEGLTVEHKKAFNECFQRFNSYPFSAIDIRDKELDEVCDIFERINQGGQKLNLFDLISASTWTSEFDLRIAVKAENERLKSKGFGEIDNEVYLQALSLIAKGSCTRPVQLQLRAEDVSKFWQDTIESMALAIDYLRNNLGVVNSVFIPYRSMIALVAYLFFKVKGRSLDHEQSELLAQWFWQTTFSERYSASILTLMTEDKKLMDKIASETTLSIKYLFNLDIDSLIQIRMYRKSAIKNGVLCLLAKKYPRHFKNNVPLMLKDGYYSDFNSSEKHHVFPKSIVQKSYPMIMVHSLPNFCFIPAELNKEISNKKPSKYFEEYQSTNPEFEDTLKTHLIKYDDSIKQDDFMSFLASRSAMILEEITRATGSKIGRVVADNVNKAIDDTENKLRDFIDKKLVTKNSDYWKNCMPSDIVGVVRQRVNEYLSKDPSKTFNDFNLRDLLDFCDIMDYSKIVLSNWDVFAPTFRSKSETEKRFLNLKEFRNAVKHGRGEIVPFIQKEGEAALEWLTIILTEVEKQRTTKTITPVESEEETIARVNSDFVKQALKLIPEWIEKEYSDGKLSIKRGNAGSHRSIKRGDELILFYYFANNWVYGELQMTTSEELQLLKERLSKPESILDRKGKYGQVRFHMMNEDDLKLIQEIIRNRVR
ncbi:MAG: DUF262 domain-containing protein [Candidatus Woesebacteria bacterium]|nr:DUF262 domain-containing protein [Candidatus Woesebacteria bacterium]